MKNPKEQRTSQNLINHIQVAKAFKDSADSIPNRINNGTR